MFNFYQNFAGSALPSGWTVIQAGGFNYTVNNGITFQAGSGDSGTLQYQTSTYNPQTNILDTYGAIETDGCMGFGAATLNGYSPCGATDAIGIVTDTASLVYTIRSANYQETSLGTSVGATNVMMSEWENTTDAIGEINYYTPQIAGVGFTAETALYPSITIAQRDVADSKMFAQYMRIRAYPPNGIMPSVKFGAVS